MRIVNRFDEYAKDSLKKKSERATDDGQQQEAVHLGKEFDAGHSLPQ